MAKRKAKRRRGFKPFKTPTRPPPNTFDPALDSQERAAQRGLTDLSQDTERTGARNLSDYQLGQTDIARQRDQGLADILRSRRIQTEDHDTALQNLQRQYTQLGNQQTQQARVAHVQGGGALLQALAKRRTNQALEQKPIDTAFARFNEQSGVDEQRLREGADIQTGRLGIEYGRGVEDASTGLSRAQRENTFYGQDINQQRFYQAKLGGYNPLAGKPKNEFTKAGLTYRTNTKVPVAKRTYSLPSGRVLNRGQFVGLLRKKRRGR